MNRVADLTIEALAQSEAELRAMVDDLLHDIDIRDVMISELLEQVFELQREAQMRRERGLR